MSLSTMTDPPSRTVARPVANLGNTCYMNAVLQALAHAPELCQAMDCEAHRSICPVAAENREKRRSMSPDGSASSTESETTRRQRIAGTRKSRRSGRKSPRDHAARRRQEESDESPDAIKFCALCELEEHLQSVHDPSMRDKPVAPESFVNGFIDQVAPWFRLGVQEDSHEFLRLLIDAMQKSCENARHAQQQSNPQDDGTKPAGGVAKIEDDEKDTEYPFSLFRGTVKSTVTCGSCKASSSTLDPIEDIGLEVAAPAPLGSMSRGGTERSSRNVSPVPATNLYDVEAAFARYSRAEALDAGYKCEKCGKVGKATKQSRLASIPPILTLHLKRFRYGTGGGGGVADVVGGRRSRSELSQLGNDFYGGKSGSAKVEGHVKFKDVFDIQAFLTEELREKHSNMLCRLFAVIVHAGKSSHSGHYIAYVRNITKNEWWKMDDGRVTCVSWAEVRDAEVYMLFYRVIGHPIATRLEHAYKLLQENQNELEEDTVGGGVLEEGDPVGSTSISSFVRTRKRPLDSGESWYRTKTNTPPHLKSLIRHLEERLADNVNLTPDLLRLIHEYMDREDTSSSSDGNGKADIVDDDGYNERREKILDALYQFMQWLEQEKGIKTSEMLSIPEETTKTRQIAPAEKKATKNILSTSATTTTADEQLVAVVEPEDMDLL